MTLDAGREVDQCTKRFDLANNKTIVIRSKEDAHDYRYFPEPDMVLLKITDDMIETARAELPELPAALKERFIKEYAITSYDADVLVAEKNISDYYDIVAKSSTNPKLAANWVVSELLREVKEIEGGLEACKIQPLQFASMIDLIDKDTISGKIGKKVFAEMLETGKDPEVIVKEKNLVQVTDTGAIEDIVREVIASNQGQWTDFIGGKDKLQGFFVGNVMKLSQGKANPGMVNQILAKIKAEV